MVPVHPLWAGLLKSDSPVLRGRFNKKYQVGDQVGYWTLLEYQTRGDGKRQVRGMFKCRCICGKIRIVRASNLTNGVSKSCGCQTTKGLKC